MYVASFIVKFDGKEDQLDPITEVFDAVVDFLLTNYPDISVFGAVGKVEEDDAETI